MISNPISIPTDSLLSGLEKINRLSLTLGQDCQIWPDHILLDLGAIDRLKAPPTTQPEFIQTTRRDVEIQLSPESNLQSLQIDAEFTRDWANAEGDRELERIARAKHLRAKAELREQIITPYVLEECMAGKILLYGGDILLAYCLPFPDGRAWTVDTLIHFSHPGSPEELYVRERRVTAREIIRYRVPGLDDAAWERQNEPRGMLDAIGWRELLLNR